MTNYRLLPPFLAFYDNDGNPAVNGTLEFYASGTTTPLDTYSNTSLTTPNANPITLDAAGRFTGDIYAPLNTQYKIILKSASGSPIDTADPVEVTGNTFDPEGAGLFDVVSNNLYPLLPPVVSASSSVTYANADWGKLRIRSNGSAMTDTLPSPSGSDFPAGWYMDVVCTGASLTVTSAANINGSGSLALAQGEYARLISTGSTYYAETTAGVGNLFARAGGTLTISSDTITVGSLSQYNVDTQGGAATDDLSTINGSSDGKIIFLRTTNDARDVVIKHNTGNIFNPAAQDITLGKTQDVIMLRWDATIARWIVVSYNNANTVEVASLASRVAGAWCRFDGTAGSPSVAAGYNVSSITKNAAGDYTINFSSAFSSANYAVCAMGAINTMPSFTATAPTTSAVRVQFKTDDGGLTDGAYVSVIVFGT